jgi:hypothetical protein
MPSGAGTVVSVDLLRNYGGCSMYHPANVYWAVAAPMWNFWHQNLLQAWRRWSAGVGQPADDRALTPPSDEELCALRLAAAGFDGDRVEPQQERPCASYAGHCALWEAEN